MTDHKPLTAAQIAEIEARAQKATPGPWRKADGQMECDNHILGGRFYVAEVCGAVTNPTVKADLEFIAHARADIPALVRDLRAAREALANLLAVNPVYRGKPLGAPNSAIRAGQEAAMRAEDAARAALPEETPNGS